MTVYSTQFAIGKQTVANELVYTVPAGKLIVVRAIDSHDSSGDASAALGTATSPFLLGVTGIPGDVTGYFMQWRGYQVFNSGEALYLQSNTNAVDFIISGYLLSTGP